MRHQGRSQDDADRYLILLLPLAKVPMIRKVLQNTKYQIKAGNWMRNLEEFGRRFSAARGAGPAEAAPRGVSATSPACRKHTVHR